MKYKKTIIFILFIFLFYLFLLIRADKIQTLSTFPAIKANLQDVVWYEKVDLSFEEINIKSKTVENINGLYLTGTKNEVVYYFHWNWWPLPYFYSEIKYINDLWYSVFAYDYPGYGKSTWFPDKKLVDEFSHDFFQYIQNEKNIKNENLIIWWYSVWTAVWTDFASKNEFAKIILVAPFSSRYDMWRKWFFWIPLQKILFLKDSYKTSELVKTFQKPALIIHWNFDMIVSFWQWKKVFDNYAGEKYFIELDKSGHNWIIDKFWKLFKNIFINFIENKLDFEYLLVNEEKKQELEQKNIQNSFSGEILETNTSIPEAKREEEISIEDKLFDFKSDSSITKYVSPNISFEKINYIPDDLVPIFGEYLIDSKWNQTLRKEAFEKLDELSRDFYNNFWTKLSIVSAYRSYEKQVIIKSWWCSDLFCAKAWHSEHQSWLAFDMFETTTKDEFLSKPYLKNYFEWMSKNAHKYGFHNSYQKWREIDWYEIEPWHWRYVWKELSQYLYEEKITFSQFYDKTKK